MNIKLHDADKTGFSNLALMKLSAYYKMRGDSVSWYMPLDTGDKVYSSRVFLFGSKDEPIGNVERGGIGWVKIFRDLQAHWTWTAAVTRLLLTQWGRGCTAGT